MRQMTDLADPRALATPWSPEVLHRSLRAAPGVVFEFMSDPREEAVYIRARHPNSVGHRVRVEVRDLYSSRDLDRAVFEAGREALTRLRMAPSDLPETDAADYLAGL